jgi:hypothetical protein
MNRAERVRVRTHVELSCGFEQPRPDAQKISSICHSRALMVRRIRVVLCNMHSNIMMKMLTR